MNKRKGLRLVQFTTHESPERTQGRAELEQLLAVLDITEDRFSEWRQLMRAMRRICPGAKELTFDELSALAQRRAENYERFLIGNDHESEDAELLDLTDTEQAPTILTIPVETRCVLPNVSRRIPSYVHSAAIAVLFCGLILVTYNESFQHVNNNVRKETTTPTPSLGGDRPKTVMAEIEPSPQTTKPQRLGKNTTRTQAPDTTSETPAAAAQQLGQERPTTLAPAVVQAQSVSSPGPQQDSNSNDKIRDFKLGPRCRILKIDLETKSISSVDKPGPSTNPSATPEKWRERGRGHPSE